MDIQFTISNLNVLKQCQETCKEECGREYGNRIIPFVQIIQMVMKSNNIDKFTAMKKIKDDNTGIYAKKHAPIFFAAALMEITESDHFVGTKK